MGIFYRSILSLHIVAVISWMAGILYLYRLIVYHTAETETVVMERFRVMEEKLYRIITLPAMTVALIAGILMLTMNADLLKMPWMHAKLLFVALLIGTTHYAGKWIRVLKTGKPDKSEKFFRVFNEVPTILMIIIVVLVIIRPF